MTFHCISSYFFGQVSEVALKLLKVPRSCKFTERADLAHDLALSQAHVIHGTSQLRHIFRGAAGGRHKVYLHHDLHWLSNLESNSNLKLRLV